MANFCPYEKLKVKFDSPISVVRKAFLSLAKVYHPDKANDKAKSSTMTEMTLACRILTDEALRCAFHKGLFARTPEGYSKAWEAANEAMQEQGMKETMLDEEELLSKLNARDSENYPEPAPQTPDIARERVEEERREQNRKKCFENQRKARAAKKFKRESTEQHNEEPKDSYYYFEDTAPPKSKPSSNEEAENEEKEAYDEEEEYYEEEEHEAEEEYEEVEQYEEDVESEEDEERRRTPEFIDLETGESWQLIESKLRQRVTQLEVIESKLLEKVVQLELMETILRDKVTGLEETEGKLQKKVTQLQVENISEKFKNRQLISLNKDLHEKLSQIEKQHALTKCKLASAEEIAEKSTTRADNLDKLLKAREDEIKLMETQSRKEKENEQESLSEMKVLLKDKLHFLITGLQELKENTLTQQGDRVELSGIEKRIDSLINVQNDQTKNFNLMHSSVALNLQELKDLLKTIKEGKIETNFRASEVDLNSRQFESFAEDTLRTGMQDTTENCTYSAERNTPKRKAKPGRRSLEKYRCSDCGKFYSYLSALQRHQAEKHNENTPEQICRICNKKLCRKESLMRHMYQIHSVHSNTS